MKSERFEYLYLLFGVLCGFLLASALGPETGVWIRRALSGAGVLFVAFFWRRIEAKAHRRYLEHWEEFRARGKWFFACTRYVLLRGAVLFVILGSPTAIELKFSGSLIFVNVLLGVVLVPLLLYLGIQEWNDCEREFEIRTIRNAAEFISLKQN